jgi:hypothetical protein
MGEFAEITYTELGFSSLYEGYEQGIIDERGFNDNALKGHSRGPSFYKQCSMCKKHGLHWQRTSDGWRLFEPTGKIHNCGRLPRSFQQ